MADNSQSCEYCSMRYVSLEKKPYKTHLEKVHGIKRDGAIHKSNSLNVLLNEKLRQKCEFCTNTYSSLLGNCYNNHLIAYHSNFSTKTSNSIEENLMDELLLNFHGDEEDDFNPLEEEIVVIKNINQDSGYFDEINPFALNKKKKFKVMHLNINSLFSKMNEIDMILQLKQYEIIFLNETKFDCFVPNSFYQNNYYDIIRRDRYFNEDLIGKKGGGIVIFIKKHYKIKFIKSLDMEFINLNLTIGALSFNFISAYKSPKTNNFQFLDALEKYMLSIDLNQPLFIIGDLNLDLLKDKNGCYSNKNGELLQQFIDNYNLINFINSPTRSATYKSKKDNSVRITNTLIDVLLHNSNLIDSTVVVDCPFSDHKFILASFVIKPIIKNSVECLSRNLSIKNMEIIKLAINEIDFSYIFSLDNVDDKWTSVTSEIIGIIDFIAPLKKIKLKDKVDQTPWVDLNLSMLKNKRDNLYSLWKKYDKIDASSVNSNKYKLDYQEAKQIYQSQFRLNMKNYNEKQTIKDFSSTKEYWNKHKSTVVLKSDKSSSSQPTMLLLDDIEIGDNLAIANAFNGFLTNIASYSEENHDSCINYINNSFDNLDRDNEKFVYNNFKILKNQHNLQTNEFDFNHLTLEDVIKAFKEIQVKSSPGSSKIPTKILKNSIDAIGPVLVDLFNTCIVTNKIPSKFKFAVCLPLLKKGSTKDMNNYRCISILPPIAKLLEKLLAN
jgi:hypothetical protein